jgi:sugar phosphate isomerase/epimerase
MLAAHLPDGGSLPWDHAMMSTQKIGYEGVLTFDVDGAPDPETTLQRAARARERLRDLLVPFSITL